MRGIIEGFYGPPWSWADRRRISETLAEAGMDTYVYAPKDDPRHRERWREHYDDAFLDDLSALAAPGALRVGFAVSPGLSIDVSSDADRAALLDKVTQVTRCGVSLVGLCLDDLPPAPGLGSRHGELTAWLAAALGPGVDLFMVPTHYTGCRRTPYLDELDRSVPGDVLVGWTGRLVVNQRITAADADAWSAALGGRRPLLWDNTPVNDALMASRLRVGPLRGRSPDLVGRIGGYLSNPMVQAVASIPALLSAAAWLRGDDPAAAWADAVGTQRVLAEGCDSEIPTMLGRRSLAGDPGATTELRAWLDAAATCEAGAWGPRSNRGRTSSAVRRRSASRPWTPSPPTGPSGPAGRPSPSSCGRGCGRSPSRCSAAGEGSPPGWARMSTAAGWPTGRRSFRRRV